MLKIGLTGGIGSGKSTVTKYFAKLKVPIVDADKIVHKLLCPRTKIYKKIIAHFGQYILAYNKTINRKKLRQIIFNNKKERKWLEKLIHPYVRIQIQKQVKLLKKPYCIIAIPLLFETKFPPKIDRILVVDCPQKIQIKRIKKRTRFTTSQIKAIIATQTKRKIRLKLANDIIHNISTLNNLKKIVKKLHNYYLSLAQ